MMLDVALWRFSKKMVTLASDEEEFFIPKQLQQQSSFNCLERVVGENFSHESVARQQLNETKA